MLQWLRKNYWIRIRETLQLFLSFFFNQVSISKHFETVDQIKSVSANRRQRWGRECGASGGELLRLADGDELLLGWLEGIYWACLPESIFIWFHPAISFRLDNSSSASMKPSMLTCLSCLKTALCEENIGSTRWWNYLSDSCRMLTSAASYSGSQQSLCCDSHTLNGESTWRCYKKSRGSKRCSEVQEKGAKF